ncbi:MAG: hypothetical protein RIS47_552 [Bacteroidota bacterium]|jgi:hypothetical protein
MKRASLFAILLGFVAVFASCEKAEVKHNVTFYNTTWVDLQMTLNGETKTLPEDGNVSFEVVEGKELIYSAVAKGEKGLTITLNSDQTTPTVLGETDKEYDVTVPADYFFLTITHDQAGVAAIDHLWVNFNGTDATDEVVSYGISETAQKVGFYKAHTGTIIKVQAGTKTDYWQDGGTDAWGFSFLKQPDQLLGLYTKNLVFAKKNNKIKHETLPGIVTAK